jgi:peroxiredoxin Q/BCP
MGESGGAPVGCPAPDFTLPTSGGGEATLSSYRGRPVVLAFLRGYA